MLILIWNSSWPLKVWVNLYELEGELDIKIVMLFSCYCYVIANVIVIVIVMLCYVMLLLCCAVGV